MGLFKLFRKNKSKIEEPQDTSKEEPYLGDLSKTEAIRQLFEIPAEQRDKNWVAKFLENVTDASFICGDPQIVQGPDGYPYFQLSIPEPNKPFQCYVIKHMIGDFLLKEGYGVIFGCDKQNPEWVFSYGDIVNYHINGEYYTQTEKRDLPAHEEIKEHEEVLVGQPSESYLPEDTRKVLRSYFENIGIDFAKLMIMNRAKDGDTCQELVFNLTPDRFETPKRYENVMRHLSWFLPRHYTYVSMSESNFKDHFKSV